MMKRVMSAALAAGLTLAIGGCSMMEKKEPAAPAAPEAPLAGTVSEGMVTVSATVEKIDLKKRRVTLKGPDGKSVTINVPEEVRNLPQVKVGDEVTATFYESIGWEVLAPGQGQVGIAAAKEAGRAEPGARPGAFGARAVTVTVKITGIDKKASTVTLEGPDGESDTVKVKDTSKLDRVAVGDLVELTYTQAVAVSVEPKAKP